MKLALALVATPLLVAAAPAPTFSDAIQICRMVFAAQIAGQADAAKAAVDSLPEDHRAYVNVVCSAYFTGMGDFVTVLQKEKARGTSI